MDENMEDGFAFAVPDLYKTSNLAHFDDTAHVMEDLQPLRKLKSKNRCKPRTDRHFQSHWRNRSSSYLSAKR